MRLMAALLLLSLSACGARPDGCAQLAPGYRYCPSAVPGPVFEAEYATTIQARSQTLHVVSRVRAGADGLDFAALSPLGQTLFQAGLRDGKVQNDAATPLAGKLDEALFVGLLQLSAWPADRIRPGLADNLTLEEAPGRRVLRDGQNIILDISWQGAALPYDRVRILVPAAGLSIQSNRLESE